MNKKNKAITKNALSLVAMKKGNGFTLVELLVAITLFSVVSLTIAGIFSMVLKSQRKAMSIGDVQEAGRYLLESMAKEIRMSTVNTGTSSGVTTINISNPRLETFDYTFDPASKQILRNGQAINPSDTEVDGRFYIETENYPSRAKVTIVIGIRSKNSRAEEGANMMLQATVAGRGH